MEKALIDIINKNLTVMGVPEYAKPAVVVQAISKISIDLELPVEPFSLDNVSTETRELIEETAKILTKITSRFIMTEFLIALTTVANNIITARAEEEAKNAYLM